VGYLLLASSPGCCSVLPEARYGHGQKQTAMNSEDWRVYAAALDDAARSLEAFSGRLQHQAGEDQPVAHPWGVLGYRGLYEAHRRLLRDLEEQAHQAGLKHETL
jgi:hypothetical protein